MKVLVIGANGATGTHVVGQLLKNDKKVEVKAMMRSADRAWAAWKDDPRVEIVEASINDLSVGDLKLIMDDCEAVVSTLGHNLTFKGVYQDPKRLVRDTVMKVCHAAELMEEQDRVKVLLMNTNGNSNRKIKEKKPFMDRLVVGLVRLLLPPHADNEAAADYLWQSEHKFKKVEWSVIRPDNLSDDENTSAYRCFESPVQSAIFTSIGTSRINVGDFMSQLILDADAWNKWQGKMPVIYNSAKLN